jgi:hypothetical protein
MAQGIFIVATETKTKGSAMENFHISLVVWNNMKG